MAREIEKAVFECLVSIYGAPRKTPLWLMRPGITECGDRWELIQEIYRTLTGCKLPEVMPARERRSVDGVFNRNGSSFIFELDEKQHFNEFRATTLQRYSDDVVLAFSPDIWIERSLKKKRLEGGGFARPKPPLFPGENGRHKQRAFRDSLTDILPAEHGWLPTLRLGDFEVAGWIRDPNATNKLAVLLESRFHHASE